MADARLSVILTLRDELSRQLNAAGGRIQRFGQQVRMAGLFAMGAGLALAAGIGLMIRSARDSALTDIGKLETAARLFADKFGIPFEEAFQLMKDAAAGDEGALTTLNNLMSGIVKEGGQIVEILPNGTTVIKNLGIEAENTEPKVRTLHDILKELGVDPDDNLTKLGASIGNVSAAIGSFLLPAANQMAGGLNQLLEKFNELSPAQQAAISWAIVGGAAFLVLGGWALTASVSFVTLAGALGMTAGALAGTLLVIALVTAAIIAVIVAGYLLQKNWDSIMNFLAEKAAAMGNAVIGVVNGVIGALEGMVNGAINALNSLANAANSVIGRVVKAPTIPNVSLSRVPTIGAGQLQRAISGAGQFVMGSGLMGGAGIGFGLGSENFEQNMSKLFRAIFGEQEKMGALESMRSLPGQDLHIHFDGPVLGNEEQARMYAREISKYLREEDRTRRGLSA